MKKLATLLLTISLSVNAVPEGDIDPRWLDDMNQTSHQTSVNIEGAFGMKLGATYNQDFLNSSYFATGGNWIVPSKPIDILSRYQLFVDKKKVAWQIVGHGKATTKSLCQDERTLLLKAINNKYEVKVTAMEDFLTDIIIIRNLEQGRVIDVSCMSVNAHNFDPDADNTRVTVIYRDNMIRDKYKEAEEKKREAEEKKRINSWDI